MIIKATVSLCMLSLLAIATHAAMDSSLADAAKRRDEKMLRVLLESKSDVNSMQPDGATALQWAAHWDDLSAADLLIKAGADVNLANEYGVTPLSLACTNGSAAMVRRLLAAGANPNLRLKTGVTPLMTCASTGKVDAVNELLNAGADVNLVESTGGQSALMWAIAERNPKVAGSLIERGANVRARSKRGFTPLLFAAQQGDIESARMLLAAGISVDDASTPGEKDVDMTSSRNGAMAKMGNGRMTPLLVATVSGQESMAIFLLEKGADPNASDKSGTALHYALRRGIAYLNRLDATGGGDDPRNRLPNMDRLIEALLIRGADPNVKLKGTPGRGGVVETNGATPLVLAAASADKKAVDMLLKAGVDPMQDGLDGTNPLMAAAGLGRSEERWPEDKEPALEIVKLLIERGADVNAANKSHGQTALHGAARIGENAVIRVLATAGANLNVMDHYGQTPLTMSMGIYTKRTPNYHVGPLGGQHRVPTAQLLVQLGAASLEASGVEILDILDDTGKAVPGRLAGR